MRNTEVANILYEIADILEFQNIKFKPQAYRKAARSIESLEEPIEKADLTSISGVGEAISRKIEEILSTGKLQYLEKLRKEIPTGVNQLLLLPEIGPKTALLLASQGINTIEALEKALDGHTLRKMKGFGPKTEENLKRSINLCKSQKQRKLLGKVLPLCQMLERALAPVSEKVVIAGSIRRWKETVGDIDILVISSESEKVMDIFTTLPLVQEVLSKGNTRSTVVFTNGLQSDVRVLPSESFGATLQYFTGSKKHNIAVRNRAIKKGFKLSEYGLFERDTEKRLVGETEEEIYAALGLQFIPPELREDKGEIAAAETGSLPSLVERAHIKGDLHVHTTWSDGHDTIAFMAAQAQAFGYEYLGICDHSRSTRIAHGLSVKKLLEQNAAIKDMKRDKITLLSGVECDILPDGSLDYPDSVLEQLDYVVASIHSRLKSSGDEVTRRIIKAIENPLVRIIGHPTGRIIGRREPVALDLENICEKALDTKTALEVNAYPDRLDLKDTHVKQAKEKGVLIAIGTDAHSTRDMEYMELGVRTARRGWAEPENVLNTKDLHQLTRFFYQTN